MFNRVAAVHKETSVAIDEGDFGGDGGGIQEGRVEYSESVGGVVGIDRVAGEGGDGFEGFEGGGWDGVVGDWDGDGCACAVVGDGDGLAVFHTGDGM